MWSNFTSTATFFRPERYRNHVKEMLTQIISSAEAEMSLDLGPRATMQKKRPKTWKSQRERPLVNHDTTPPMQTSGRMKLCVHLVIWMNLAQEVSDMTVQKTSARTFCHEKQNFYDWWYFRTSNWGDGRYCTAVKSFSHAFNSWSTRTSPGRSFLQKPRILVCTCVQQRKLVTTTNSCKDGEDLNHFWTVFGVLH